MGRASARWSNSTTRPTRIVWSPAARASCRRQWRPAGAALKIGGPCSSVRSVTSAGWSAPAWSGIATRVQGSACPSLSRCTARCCASPSISCIRPSVSTLDETSGDSNDSAARTAGMIFSPKWRKFTLVVKEAGTDQVHPNGVGIADAPDDLLPRPGDERSTYPSATRTIPRTRSIRSPRTRWPTFSTSSWSSSPSARPAATFVIVESPTTSIPSICA